MKTTEETIKAIATKHAEGVWGRTDLVTAIESAITEALDTVDDKHLASELWRVEEDRDGWMNKYLAEVEAHRVTQSKVSSLCASEQGVFQELTDLRFAADGFQAIAAKLEQERESLVGMLRVAKCPNCDGSGAIVEIRGNTEYVSRDMAHDAGDPSLEGSVYNQPEPELQQCQWCAERAVIAP